MSSQTKTIFFADYIFQVWENVYEPAEDSFLLAEHLTVNIGESVLDMGTGCGILGVIAARNASKVVAIDINPHAVRCARHNAKLNHVEDKMLFIAADLFTPLTTKAKFDVILFNAPYLPTEKTQENDSWLERAWTGGTTGRYVIDRFIQEAPRRLKQDSRILLVQSNLANMEKTTQKLKKHNLEPHIIANLPLPFFETLTLLKATYPK